MLERLGRLAPWKQYGLLVLVSLALFLPFLWMMPLTEADEAIYAEATREMITTGNYLMPHFNSAPFYEKPIMTFWLQAASCRVFGISAFAVRLPSALLSLLLVLVLFAFLRVFSKQTAKRAIENRKYVTLRDSVKKKAMLLINRVKEYKTHRYRSCPNCHSTLRLQKKIGTMSVTCPKCRTSFQVTIKR